VAVVSDIVEIARDLLAGRAGATPLGYTDWHPARLVARGNAVAASYLRLIVHDRPGILAKIGGILGRHRINIDSVLQEPAPSKEAMPFAMTLEPARQDRVESAVREVARLRYLAEPPVLMPFLDDLGT
jgi:homoserine dehydrogenase